MIDQNTTIILSSAITVIGTLGGAIAGVVLTNRHSSKLEELKGKQEKAKRDAEIIQEVYSLLMKIHERAMNNISHHEFPSDGSTEELGRVKALTHLYLPSAMDTVDGLLEAIDGLGISIMSTKEEKPTKEEQKEISHAFRDYNNHIKFASRSPTENVKYEYPIINAASHLPICHNPAIVRSHASHVFLTRRYNTV